jgi:hypothetical protein
MISPSYTDLSLPGVAEDALAEFDRAEIAGTLEDWARKWGREMAMTLAQNPMIEDDVDDIKADLKEAEQDVSCLKSEAKDLTQAIQSAINILEAAL